MQLPIEFEQRMQQLLQDEYTTFIDGYERPLRRGLRINTNKIDVARLQRCSPIPFPLLLSPQIVST